MYVIGLAFKILKSASEGLQRSHCLTKFTEIVLAPIFKSEKYYLAKCLRAQLNKRERGLWQKKKKLNKGAISISF